MNSSLFEKRQLKKLAAEIGCSTAEIRTLVAEIDLHYRSWTEKKINMKTGDFKRYKDGTIKQRIISPSDARLASLQKKLNKNLLAKIPLPPNVHGGVTGKNNITNALPHKGKKYIFTTDLQDFYPNISPKQVVNAVLRLGFSHHYAHWIAKLTTWKHQVPQGAPTSGHIANIVFLETDLKLIALCERHDITYTRYVDDLTFSSPRLFDDQIPIILDFISEGGFKISRRKTNLSAIQSITGIEVYNNRIDAPEEIKAKVQEES